MSSIADFFNKETVFVTGVTGFLGKLTVEKILRTSPDVHKIYILVRPKPNRTLDQRFHDIFSQPCFDTLKSLNPDFASKIHPLNGDCSQPLLGLSPEALTIIKNEVSCVIHVAANVRFDVDLKTAVYTNVRSVRDLLELMKEVQNIKAFVYVSTAFSHCHRKVIDEEFYDVGVDPEKLLQMVDIVDDRTLRAVTPHILGEWPNTYVYTKALAEEVIRTYKQTLPVTIVRPAIVTSTSSEPIAGWVGNIHGIVGVIVGAALGVIRTIHMDANLRATIVPADFVVNNILAAAWSVAKDKSESVSIYNFSGCQKNTMTWGRLNKEFEKYIFVYPLSSAVWYLHFSISPHVIVHKIRVFFLHTLFAYLVDSILFIVGKRTLAVEKYRKINKLIDVISYFTTHSWDFRNRNVDKLWEKLSPDDKKLFNFDMKNFDWGKYIENCTIGGRVYLMNDPLETLPQAKKRMYVLAAIHYFFVALLLYFLYHLLFTVFRAVF